MFLEIKVPTKAFGTDIARIGFLVVMSMHVKSQVIYLMKSFVTYRTLVLFFSTMGKFVILVVTLLVKAFTAVFTRIWFVVQMNPHMGIQGRAPVESLPASLTFVGLF